MSEAVGVMRTPSAAEPDWVEALSTPGRARDDAVERLHALLLRAARFEVARRRRALGHVRDNLDDLATQAADDALMAIMAKLDTYRGESRFTTWAYKFALLEAAREGAPARLAGPRDATRGEGWSRLPTARDAPAGDLETAELLGAVRDGDRRRADPAPARGPRRAALNDVPIDVLAERLGTTRGALYKTLHDARRKLRARLADADWAVEGGDAMSDEPPSSTRCWGRTGPS